MSLWDKVNQFAQDVGNTFGGNQNKQVEGENTERIVQVNQENIQQQLPNTNFEIEQNYQQAPNNQENEVIANPYAPQLDPSCKFILYGDKTSQLEVYEDYAKLCYIPKGISNMLGNAMRGGAVNILMQFQNMDIALNEKRNVNMDIVGLELSIQHKQENYSMVIQVSDKTKADEIINYIYGARQLTATMLEPKQKDEIWNSEEGVERCFILQGKEALVGKELDVFNTYRLKFREIAMDCADCARKEYDKKVKDLTSYIEFFPEIYEHYLTIICDKAVQILIGESIWTITLDDFKAEHIKNWRLALDNYQVTLESVLLTVQNNQAAVASLMSYVPHLSGGGFGLAGAVKGMAKATAFNVVRDSVASSVSKSSANINPAQQKELYERINHDNVFDLVFTDYWRCFLTLTAILRDNGKEIWSIEEAYVNKANSIFANFRNPNFPKDKILDAILTILTTYPYNIEYHKYLVEYFGDTDEVSAINKYFGYTSFDNPRIT